MKRYLFIGDSHPFYLILNKKATMTEPFLHLKDGMDEAISLYKSSTMFSFNSQIDWVLQNSTQDASMFEAVVFIFGTNDAMKRGDGYAPLSECVDKYLEKVSEVSERLGSLKTVVTSPIACGDPTQEPNMQGYLDKYWPFETIKERLVILDSLLEEGCKKYPNLNFLSMLRLLQDSSGAIKKDLSLDGIHFNHFGRSLYMNRLAEFLATLA